MIDAALAWLDGPDLVADLVLFAWLGAVAALALCAPRGPR
jgi:hypothetical protein